MSFSAHPEPTLFNTNTISVELRPEHDTTSPGTRHTGSAPVCRVLPIVLVSCLRCELKIHLHVSLITGLPLSILQAFSWFLPPLLILFAEKIKLLTATVRTFKMPKSTQRFDMRVQAQKFLPKVSTILFRPYFK